MAEKSYTTPDSEGKLTTSRSVSSYWTTLSLQPNIMINVHGMFKQTCILNPLFVVGVVELFSFFLPFFPK